MVHSRVSAASETKQPLTADLTLSASILTELKVQAVYVGQHVPERPAALQL